MRKSCGKNVIRFFQDCKSLYAGPKKPRLQVGEDYFELDDLSPEGIASIPAYRDLKPCQTNTVSAILPSEKVIESCDEKVKKSAKKVRFASSLVSYSPLIDEVQSIVINPTPVPLESSVGFEVPVLLQAAIDAQIWKSEDVFRSFYQKHINKFRYLHVYLMSRIPPTSDTFIHNGVERNWKNLIHTQNRQLSYIGRILDTDAFGHCGFAAIAWALMGDQKRYQAIRLASLIGIYNFWDFIVDSSTVEESLKWIKTACCNTPSAPYENQLIDWMTMSISFAIMRPIHIISNIPDYSNMTLDLFDPVYNVAGAMRDPIFILFRPNHFEGIIKSQSFKGFVLPATNLPVAYPVQSSRHRNFRPSYPLSSPYYY